jgi:peptide/nickel transport system permease protein
MLSLGAFFAVRALPGDPAQLIGFGADKAKIEQIRTDLGLNESYPAQYAKWAGNLLSGDFGKYYREPNTVGERLSDALPISLELMLYTQIVALIIAIPLGVVTAYRANSLFDKGSNIGAFLALSVPGFVLAFVLKKYLALDNSIFPERGWTPITDGLGEHFKHAVLPVLTLVFSQIAVYFRLLRSDMIATLQEDFVTMAKSKGLKPKRILFRHALRPSSLTLLTVAGLNVGTLISTAVIVENIFGTGGLGNLLVRAVFAREYVATQSYIVVLGLIFVLINFTVDFLYTVIDPRIRHAG